MEFVKFDLVDEVATITLDRDQKRNAFNQQMSEEVIACLERSQQGKARAIVIRANSGVKIWSAGHDLSELTAEDPTRSDPMFQLFDRVQTTPLPVIALVEGDVYAGALELIVVCDLAIASEQSRIAMTANKMGLPFSPEIYHYWSYVLGIHKIKELFFTAATIDARDAYIAGIFNQIVAPEQLDATVAAIIEKIKQCAPEGIANTKMQINTLSNSLPLSESQRAEIERSRQALLASPEFLQRVQALLNKIHQKS